VRLPLEALTVASPEAESLRPFVDQIADEVNVKEVRLSTELAEVGTFVLQLVPAALGPRLGKDTQKVLAAVRQGDWERAPDGSVVAGGVQLHEGEYTLKLAPADQRTTQALESQEGLVVLDLEVTPDLEAEGVARDVIRAVQTARRDAGLDVSDRIHLVLDLPDDAKAAVQRHKDFIAGEVLAREVVLAGPISNGRRAELNDGRHFHIGLHKVD
jgi:isoleucyl-tRNA synthetase